MALFGGSDSRTAASAADQGQQTTDEALGANINLSAGDDQSATVNVTRNTTTQINQEDNSDNSITQIDNSSESTSVLENSNNTTNVSQIDNSVSNSNNQTRTETTLNQIDNSRTFVTTTDFGAVKGGLQVANRALGAMLEQTNGVFATVDSVLELQGALTDETLTLLADSFDASVDQIQESAQTEVERGLGAVFDLTENVFYLIGGLAAIAGLVAIYKGN